MIEQPAFWETLLSADLALRSPLAAYGEYLNKYAQHKEPSLNFTTSADETLDERELRMAEHTLGNLPLTIVSIEKVPPDHRAWQIKRHAYEVVAKKLSRRGVVIDVGDTSHNVQLDQPERTESIILEAIRASRADQHHER